MQTPVDELEGRELDAAVAEEIMEWIWVEWIDSIGVGGRFLVGPEHLRGRKLGEYPYKEASVDAEVQEMAYDYLPKYSTDPAAAKRVVEKILEEMGGGIILSRPPNPEPGRESRWYMMFSCLVPEGNVGGYGSTAEEAICRAALRAVRK